MVNHACPPKWRLDAPGSHHESHWLGLSYGAPVSEVEEFDVRLKVSYFYHF